MIKKRDVLKVKVPFPDIDSGLAKKSHMYICVDEKYQDIYTVKCQTFKNELLKNPGIKHYKIVRPSLTDNPFQRPTLLEFNKIFQFINGVNFGNNLKTQIGISRQLYSDIYSELSVIPNQKINLICYDRKDIQDFNKQ